MTFIDRVRGLVGDISYKPNYELLVREDVEFVKSDGQTRLYLQVQCFRPCAVTGEMGRGRGGKFYLSPHMVDGEIVRKAFQALISYEEHECREFFRYQGKQIFGPHISVEALMRAADETEVRTPAG